MPIPLGPIQVNSSLFLHVFVGAQRCACGGAFRTREHRTVRRGGASIRKVFVICKRCRRPRLFEFDVSGLVRIGDDRNRFLRTVTRFLDGMRALKRSDLETARARLEEALDENTGEPSFTAAHYYLGRIAIQIGRPQEAVHRFHRAALLQPMEIPYHEALCEAYRAASHPDAALAELALIEDLKLRLAPGPKERPAFDE